MANSLTKKIDTNFAKITRDQAVKVSQRVNEIEAILGGVHSNPRTPKEIAGVYAALGKVRDLLNDDLYVVEGFPF